MFLFKLSMDILLSHLHAVRHVCFPEKGGAAENHRDMTPRNDICDELCVSYISKGT